MKKNMELAKIYYESPVGLLELSGTDNSLESLLFVDKERGDKTAGNAYLERCVTQLDEYFSGSRKVFTINLDPDGTDFQKSVWAELVKIPFGVTTSYLQLSETLGDVKAIRAVANANKRNRIAIIIPCHRVIGSDGSLVGYAGGLWRKKWLLEHEQSFISGEKQLDLF